MGERGVKAWAVAPGVQSTTSIDDNMAQDMSLGGDIVRRVVEGERGVDLGSVVYRIESPV